MLTLKSIAADQWLSVWIAVVFAEDVLHLFEEKYPSDMRPRNAVDAAKAWMNNPCEETAAAAAAADAAAAAAAVSDAAAADAAADAAYAAAAVSDAAAADAADDAAYAAADAAYADKEFYIHNLLRKHLSFIINYKVKHNQGFGCIEEVFEAADNKGKEKLLWMFKD